jgi:hypothetical protein
MWLRLTKDDAIVQRVYTELCSFTRNGVHANDLEGSFYVQATALLMSRVAYVSVPGRELGVGLV